MQSTSVDHLWFPYTAPAYKSVRYLTECKRTLRHWVVEDYNGRYREGISPLRSPSTRGNICVEEHRCERGCSCISKAQVATRCPALTFLVHPSSQSHSPFSVEAGFLIALYSFLLINELQRTHDTHFDLGLNLSTIRRAAMGLHRLRPG